MPPLIVDRDAFAELVSLSVATVDRMKAAEKIGPPPIKLSSGRIGWRYESVCRWIEEAERLGRLPDRSEWQALCEQATKNG